YRRTGRNRYFRPSKQYRTSCNSSSLRCNLSEAEMSAYPQMGDSFCYSYHQRRRTFVDKGPTHLALCVRTLWALFPPLPAFVTPYQLSQSPDKQDTYSKQTKDANSVNSFRSSKVPLCHNLKTL
ncbi:hypothetical protein ACTXT7_012549, partial [Hymenolepis weldensis]